MASGAIGAGSNPAGDAWIFIKGDRHLWCLSPSTGHLQPFILFGCAMKNYHVGIRIGKGIILFILVLENKDNL